MNSTHRPTVECNNPIGCGNTLYEPGYDSDMRPIWRCTNCGQETPRQSRSRRSNALRALDAIRMIQVEWKETETALHALVDAGIPNGCLLVHGVTFNWHLDALRGMHMKAGQKKLSNWDVRYHSARAREDLERAKKFVQEKQNELSARTLA